MAQVPREEALEGIEGIKIFFRCWCPPGEARAAVVICYEFNSHGVQYSWTSERFVVSGLAVYALDLRGCGKSGGKRFYVDNIADCVSDLANRVSLAKSQEPNLAVFLLGHSADGVVPFAYALENQAELAEVICESFCFKVPAPDFSVAVIKEPSYVARIARANAQE